MLKSICHKIKIVLTAYLNVKFFFHYFKQSQKKNIFCTQLFIDIIKLLRRGFLINKIYIQKFNSFFEVFLKCLKERISCFVFND